MIEGHELYLRTRNGRFDLHWVDPFGGDDEEQVGDDKIVAPLPGTVVALLAEVGATLEKGAPILTLEVMKMEQTLRAPFAGVLSAIKCKVGDIVGRASSSPRSSRQPREAEISMSDSVRIVEVGPRDGLQNEKTPVSVEDRIAFIEALIGAGLHTVEVGAFVSPKAIPQMVNSDAVLRGVAHHRGQRIPRAGAERKGLRGRARRRRQGDRGVRLGLGRLFPRQYQLHGGGIDRALQAGAGARQGRRHQGARLYLLRARLPL